MRILVFYGKSIKDETYEITKQFLTKFDRASVKEYFLPDDMSKPCLGCGNCYLNSEKNCYAFRQINKIYENMTDADLIVFATPTYVDNIPGHLKSFFDHFGFLWMLRRPNGIMFKKRAVIIATTDKLSFKNTIKEIKKNLNWWGISNIYSCGININNKLNVDNSLEKIYIKVINSKIKIKYITKKRFIYSLRQIKKHPENEYDYNYWMDNGWLNRKRPWKF
ncbi:MAG: flavodoxin family protein [Bacilli bacterium]|nr:flavodoxin family protein [Bacilli bacterium]